MEFKINKTLKIHDGKQSQTYAECDCSQCGEIVTRKIHTLKIWSGLCRRCSNLAKLVKARLVPNPANGKPYEALYNNFCKHTKAKGKTNDLTFVEFVEFTSINECHYCKSEVKWTVRNLTKNGSKYNLDRKDNSLGYSKYNCVPCCWRCNNGKGSSFTYEEWHGMTAYQRKNEV